MNVQEANVLNIFGQRLDDHVKVCAELHQIIREDVKRIEGKLDNIASQITGVSKQQNREEGGHSATVWIVATVLSLVVACSSIGGLILAIANSSK